MDSSCRERSNRSVRDSRISASRLAPPPGASHEDGLAIDASTSWSRRSSGWRQLVRRRQGEALLHGSLRAKRGLQRNESNWIESWRIDRHRERCHGGGECRKGSLGCAHRWHAEPARSHLGCARGWRGRCRVAAFATNAELSARGTIQRALALYWAEWKYEWTRHCAARHSNTL